MSKKHRAKRETRKIQTQRRNDSVDHDENKVDEARQEQASGNERHQQNWEYRQRKQESECNQLNHARTRS